MGREMAEGMGTVHANRDDCCAVRLEEEVHPKWCSAPFAVHRGDAMATKMRLLQDE